MPSFEVGSGIDIDDGDYEATIQSIEPLIRDSNQPSKYGDKQQSVITWRLRDTLIIGDEEYSDIERRQFVNDVEALTPKSKWYQVFSAVLNGGKPLEKGEKYATDDLIGKSAIIYWGSYIGEDGTTKQKVITVKPPKKSSGMVRRKVSDEEQQIDTDKALAGL